MEERFLRENRTLNLGKSARLRTTNTVLKYQNNNSIANNTAKARTALEPSNKEFSVKCELPGAMA
jgi:hypothetical protein